MGILNRLLYSLFERLHRMRLEGRRQQTVQQIQSRAKRVGRDFCLNGEIALFGVEALEIGDNVHIGEGAHIHAEGGLSIGSHTHISRRATIYTSNHNYRGERLPYDETLVNKPVWVGEAVWIGMNVTMLPGTMIGDGAIIGAGCVIRGEVPPMAIVSRDDSQSIIGRREEEHYRKLVEQQSFGGSSGKVWRPISNE